MGLDMYLEKELFIGAQFSHRNITGEINLQHDGKPIPIDTSKVSIIIEQAAYWRKANAIHSWFVKNVQDGEDDCGRYEVSRGEMKKLLETINKVLDSAEITNGVIVNGYTSIAGGPLKPNYESGKIILNDTIASELLPTQAGFFFGGTDYNEYYINDLVYTKEILEGILQDKNDYYAAYYYTSSW